MDINNDVVARGQFCTVMKVFYRLELIVLRVHITGSEFVKIWRRFEGYFGHVQCDALDFPPTRPTRYQICALTMRNCQV